MSPFRARNLRLALGGALLTAPLVASAALVAPAVAAGPSVVAGKDWTVSQVAGGYEVVVDLDAPLPVRSDAPTVVVDGEPVGIATESADGLSLSVFTADPAVLDADRIASGWASQTPASEVAESADTTAVEVPELSDDAARDLDVDPSAPGSFEWTESIYKFGDQAIALAAIGGVRGELEGKIYLPTTGGARPTVLLLHGRHTSCYGELPSNPAGWPCAVRPGATPADEVRRSIPSYAGYDGTARALASNGYAVVSISANAINSNDNQLAPDQGAQARGQLLLDTLTMLQGASAGQPVSYFDAWQNRTVGLEQALDDGAASYAVRSEGFVGGAPPLDDVSAADLVGRFDLTQIGMMGHSRGGEGVTSAATLNQGLAEPWPIESILPLAPVDFGRMTVPNVPMNVLLPYCDGDVSNQQGQHMLDDSRYAFGDDALRSATWVMGANHNFYNTVWTPGKYAFSVSDDWSGTSTTSARATEPICGTAPSTAATSIRMTAEEQYDQGTSYMTAWFRLTMGGEEQFLPMFDGTGEVPAALNGEDVRTVATAPSTARSTLTAFEAPTSLVRTFGSATAAPCASLAGRTTPQSLPACATTLASSQAPHWTPASNGGNVPATPLTRMTWASSTGQVRVAVPAGRRDATGADRLAVKMAADETVTTGTELTLSVLDGAGVTYSAPVSTLNPLALVRFPTSASSAAVTTLKKVVLQQVNVPVADLATAGLDVSDLREVRFTAGVGADGTANGAAYLSDLAFESSSVGTPSVAKEPVIDVYAPAVDEGNAPGTVDLAVYLDQAADEPVTGFVSFLGSTTSRAGATMERVAFAPGETCRVVTAALQGDTLASTSNGSTVKASVINTSGAVMGTRAIVNSLVREDDGTTSSAGPLPPVGTPAPVCAELAGVLAGGEIGVPANATPGGPASVTVSGYRAGESVLVTAPGVASVRVVTDQSGTATATLELPAGLAPGPLPVTALGAGTGRVSAGALPVRTSSTTTLTIDPEVPVLREPVTLTATVTGGDTTGTVEFLDGTTSLGTAPTTDGVAVLEVPGFGPGAHSLTAVFATTEVTFGSTSAPIGFTLDQRASTAVLTFDVSRTTFGTPVVASVAVAGATEGTVELSFEDDVVSLPVDETGHATFRLPRLTPVGGYTLQAQFTGTEDVAPSAVSEASFEVLRKAASTEIRAPRAVTGGSTMTVRVRVADVVRGAPATGQISLRVLAAGGERTLTRQLGDGNVAVFSVQTGRRAEQLVLYASYPGSRSYLGADAPPKVVRLR